MPVSPTRFDGVELIRPAIFVLRSAKATKVRVYLAVAGISRVRVNAIRICLPYFEESILNWVSLPIVHNACQPDAFADRVFVHKDVLFFAVDQPDAQKGTCGLGGGLREWVHIIQMGSPSDHRRPCRSDSRAPNPAG